MSLELFRHPFSSYCWKALIALHENATPFTWRMFGPGGDPDNEAELARRWPIKKLPILADGERTIVETEAIIEYLDRYYPGPVPLLPGDAAAVETRMMTRVFDEYVMNAYIKPVGDALRPPEARDPFGVAYAERQLDTVYAWLDERLAGRAWTAGEAFTLAHCAAAPALFYADWVRPIPEMLATLRARRAKLPARPSVARRVEDARPYRHLFPLGAPDRD